MLCSEIMYTEIKCKKCRKIIINASQCSNILINAHHEPLTVSEAECYTILEQNVVFLTEDSVPKWIKQKIEEAEWSKGRINCVNCESRLGGFDFISGTKCQCEKNVVPSIHLIKSKIDLLRT